MSIYKKYVTEAVNSTVITAYMGLQKTTRVNCFNFIVRTLLLHPSMNI